MTNEKATTVTKIVDGIEVTINPKILTDWDVSMALVDIMEPDDGSMDALAKKMKLMNFVFIEVFGEDQFSRIKDALKSRYDGMLPIEEISTFLGKVFTAFSEKKS